MRCPHSHLHSIAMARISKVLSGPVGSAVPRAPTDFRQLEPALTRVFQFLREIAGKPRGTTDPWREVGARPVR